MKLTERLVAHRGYSQRYPENTLLAVEQAITSGAKYVEVDIQLTSDHIPVLFHDRNLMRLCRATGAIHDFTLEELGKTHPLNFDRFANQFSDINIPRLSDFVTLLKMHPRVTAFIELKRISIHEFGESLMVEKVIAALEPIKNQCVIISYSSSGLQCVRDNGWQKIGTVVDKWAEQNREDIFSLKPEYFFVDHISLPEGNIKLESHLYPHSMLAVFECSDPQRALELFQHGVCLVETNDIAMMIQKLRK